MATQTQFVELLADIEPSPTTKSKASNAHNALRDFLQSHSTFKQVHAATFLSGSYKRDTAIRPRIVDGELSRPDVDIIVVTNHTLSNKPSEVISLLYRTLQEKYVDIRRQARSVGIETALADMDAVPVIAPCGPEGDYYIPDREQSMWLKTNPKGHTTWTVEMNRVTDGRFKQLVKLMKWWRRINPTSANATIAKRPKGFVIECIVAECMSRTETNYALLFRDLLQAIVKRYQLNVAYGLIPQISDPAVAGNNVTSNMSFESFSLFHSKVKEHLDFVEHALKVSTSDPAKELELWRKVFGDRFPAAASQKSTDLLSQAVTPSNLFFPNHPIQPKKPGGFA